MLRMIQCRAAEAAKSYYSRSDYFDEGQEQVGSWGGKLAARLGLSGKVEKRDFERLCDNLHPATGEPLTGRTRSDRTVAYDINLHVPKGVSVAYELLGDERIREAFDEEAQATLEELEGDARTRVRKAGCCEDRLTRNLVWAEYTHLTSRPVDGEPDPHLHKHFVVFNATWDEQEQEMKACQFREIKRDAPYFEAAFHARLAKRLAELGYRIERKGKQWDIADIPQRVRDEFSRRSELIEALARAEGIVDAAAKDKLGASTREQKRCDLSMEELISRWWARLSEEEQADLKRVLLQERKPQPVTLTPNEVLELGMLHSFERQSVVPKRNLLAESLRFGLGEVTVEGIHQASQRPDILVRKIRGRELATTREVLAEEQAMIEFAREGKGQAEPLNDDWVIQRDWLNREQRTAIRHVLGSRDRVMLLRGGAGTGKTSLMQEAVAGIEAGGHQVITLAPSAQASRGVLQSEGFAGATTVAELLVNEKLQDAARNNVIWIDEAGMLGSRTLHQVFGLADRLNSRVVLSGDWKQHGSVERGAALKLLETHAGIQAAEVSEIQRQKDTYKTAVQAIAAGNLLGGFERLAELGWIHELDDDARAKAAARTYADTLERKQSALVVSPTHAESRAVSDAIRAELKARRRLAGSEREVLQLTPLHLTEAQRNDAAWYQPGDVIVFQQNAKGHKAGERIRLNGAPSEPLRRLAKRFAVFRASHLPVAAGEQVRITANGKSMDGKHRLNNGATYTVQGFTARGDLRLSNGWVIARDYGNLAHGYVTTSHAAQGKTVDHVILVESQLSYPAAGEEQLYVSASRGRRQCTILTDSKESLLEAVSRRDARMSATELTDEEHRKRHCLLAAAAREMDRQPQMEMAHGR
jgi:conjugative relaxase-like TrwC/TraI family protein